jgi:hypothetical protein
MEATAGTLLLHVPPEVVWNKVSEAPAQRLEGPVIAAGAGLTVTTVVAEHPPTSAYVIIEVPLATPVTIPVALPMVALLTSPLLHVPPDTALLNVYVEPAQIVTPAIAAGNGVTVTMRVARQLPPTE